MTALPPEVARLRAEVDRVDARLAELLCERARLAEALGRVKRGQGLAMLDPAREEAILTRVAAQARPPLSPEALRRVWGAILAESRAIVTRAVAGE